MPKRDRHTPVHTGRPRRNRCAPGHVCWTSSCSDGPRPTQLGDGPGLPAPDNVWDERATDRLRGTPAARGGPRIQPDTPTATAPAGNATSTARWKRSTGWSASPPAYALCAAKYFRQVAAIKSTSTRTPDSWRGISLRIQVNGPDRTSRPCCAGTSRSTPAGPLSTPRRNSDECRPCARRRVKVGSRLAHDGRDEPELRIGNTPTSGLNGRP